MRSHQETMELLARANKQLERVPDLAKENAQLKADLEAARASAKTWHDRFLRLEVAATCLYKLDWVWAHTEPDIRGAIERGDRQKGVGFWIALRDALGLPPGQRTNKADRPTQRAMIALNQQERSDFVEGIKGVHTPQGYAKGRRAP